MAAPALPTVLASPTLDGFLPRSGVNARTEPLDADRDRLFLEFPQQIDKEFFRLEFPGL
jgi:hypothetical protein